MLLQKMFYYWNVAYYMYLLSYKTNLHAFFPITLTPHSFQAELLKFMLREWWSGSLVYCTQMFWLLLTSTCHCCHGGWDWAILVTELEHFPTQIMALSSSFAFKRELEHFPDQNVTAFRTHFQLQLPLFLGSQRSVMGYQWTPCCVFILYELMQCFVFEYLPLSRDGL